MHFQTSSWARRGSECNRWLRLMVLALIALGSAQARAQNFIIVDGATCTLPKAIGLANSANFVDPTAIGSATTDFTGCATIPPPGPPSYLPPPGAYTLLVATTQITLTSIDNYWYGPNALPPIASSISIVPTAGTLTLTASHAGGPQPSTANAFRFFYVSGGLEIQAGSLSIQNTVLGGGNAKGGDSQYGGGGAGMGGAIFNQGNVALSDVSLIGNVARGGAYNTSGNSGGGGIGQDGASHAGGGFGGALGGTYGGSGAVGGSLIGGGGGGFLSPSSNATGSSGGGGGRLGGAGGSGQGSAPGGTAGDGGGGGGSGGSSTTGGNGGGFGAGGGNGSYGGGGGGGVGGGGDGANVFNTAGGGGGGFGGGGGSGDHLDGHGGGGGFGGGGGASFISGGGGAGGFGAGGGDAGGHGGGGAGFGGAIFNHAGTVYLLNVTATDNAARGGSGFDAAGDGSGLGAVLFNLNGNVTIDFSTLAGNLVSGNNGAGDNAGPEDATVYSLAYGNKIQDGTASSASLTIHNSIIHGTHADGGAGNDILVNVVDGTQVNSSSVVYKGKNFVQFSTNLGSVTQTGSSPTQADPLLGALSLYRSSPNLLPVLPIGSNSPAYNTADSCLEADGATTLTTDERGGARPNAGTQCDVGAYEFDGDYIFAANNEATL